jgi:uncharacterized protein
MRDLDFATISNALWQIPLPCVDCVVGIASGGIVPASLLAHQLRLPFYLLTINYRAPDNSPQRAAPELLQPGPQIPPHVRILLVDDVSVSGKTLQLAKSLLSAHETVTLTLKGNADIVVFPEIAECVAWPWKS